MLHTTASNAVLQRLSQSALQAGHRATLGLDRPRLELAATSLEGASILSSREVAALAYGHGLSVEATATLAYGGGLPAELFRGGVKRERAERLAAVPTWWSEPTAHMSDLGEGSTRRLIGALLGLDLEAAPAEAPMPVPVDARFAAFSELDLSDHWSLGVGIRDGEWNEGLSVAARDMAPKILPLLSRAEIEEAEQERYHLMYVDNVKPHQAVRRHGAGVSMVFSDGRCGWWSLFLHSKDDRLKLSINLLDQRLIECRGYHGEKSFLGYTFGEVVRKLYQAVPSSESWTLAALRFPATSSINVSLGAPDLEIAEASLLRWA